MLREPQQICEVIDAQLTAAGFHVSGGTIVQRIYLGSLAGLAVRGELSVMTPSQLILPGYVLTVEAQTGVPTRWVGGKEVPLLLGRGLASVGAIDGAIIRADDPGWARRLTDDPGARAALAALLSEVSFVEHLPSGALRMQLQRPSRPVVPPLAPLVLAFEHLLRVVCSAPPPRPAAARWTDNRTLLMVLVTVVVLGLFGAAVALAMAL